MAGHIGYQTMVGDSMVNIQLAESSIEGVGIRMTQFGLPEVVVKGMMGMSRRYQKWCIPGS